MKWSVQAHSVHCAMPWGVQFWQLNFKDSTKTTDWLIIDQICRTALKTLRPEKFTTKHISRVYLRTHTVKTIFFFHLSGRPGPKDKISHFSKYFLRLNCPLGYGWNKKKEASFLCQFSPKCPKCEQKYDFELLSNWSLIRADLAHFAPGMPISERSEKRENKLLSKL